jgi:membrane-associated protease RseP (regulator of RpoE activity)
MTDTLDPPAPGGRAPVPEPRRRAEAQGSSPWRLAILGALVLAAGLGGGAPLLIVIAALIVMIFLHELGHFLTAKWAGMKVTEFFIGFGPRIWSFRKGETEYGVKVIPAGAYVKIIGMHNLDEYDEADADRTYMSKPFWRRLSVAVAGSTMHFLLALVVLYAAFAFVGLDGGRAVVTEDDYEALRAESAWVVGEVSPGSAADDLGLELGDRIVSVDGLSTASFPDFQEAVRDRPDETVPVVYERDGERITDQVTIGEREDADDIGFFGVGPDAVANEQTAGLVGSVGESFDAFGRAVGETFHGLGQILSPSGLADLGEAAFTSGEEDPTDTAPAGSGGSGEAESTPVGIIGIADGGADLVSFGEWGHALTIFAIVNVFIGIFNLVPLLPLDGGHVAIACYEKVRSLLRRGEPYHVDVVKLLPVTYAVVLVLAFLGISTIVLDTRGVVGG